MIPRITANLLTVTLVFAGLACSRLQPANTNAPTQTLPNAVNINTASAEELQRIPHIGESLAGKIIEHREKYGPFRRPEHLMLIDGISDKRFRKIRPLVRVE